MDYGEFGLFNINNALMMCHFPQFLHASLSYEGKGDSSAHLYTRLCVPVGVRVLQLH